MGTLIVELKISDFAKSQQGFAKGEPNRQKAGITNTRMYRGVDDPNMIVVVADATDEAAARAFLSSPEIRQNMQDQGALGPPKVYFAK